MTAAVPARYTGAMAQDTCQGLVRRHDPNGYLRHFVAGLGAGMVFAAWGARPLAVVAAAAAIGAGKELYDAATGRGVVDWRDAAWTAAGGAAVAALLLLLR